MQSISAFANAIAMDGIEDDTRLINALLAWAGKNATTVAREIDVAVTTITRPANGKAKTRIGRKTLDLLQAQYPGFPEWADQAARAAAMQTNATVVPFQGEALDLPQESLPVWGSALGTARMFDGEAIEQTTLNSGDVMEYVKRPAILNGKRMAYGLHVQGSSMDPALPEGEFIVACRDMPLSIGDIVVVYLRDGEDDGNRARAVLVKTLVRRSASYIELRQYEPRLDFKVATADVLRMDRVLTRREMLS